MCPIGENADYCKGWDNNNGDYGNGDCGDEYANYTGQITNLIGCPLHIMKPNQIGGLSALVGKWNIVDRTETEVSKPVGISGTMLFNNNGYMKMTIPNKSGFRD